MPDTNYALYLFQQNYFTGTGAYSLAYNYPTQSDWQGKTIGLDPTKDPMVMYMRDDDPTFSSATDPTGQYSWGAELANLKLEITQVVTLQAADGTTYPLYIMSRAGVTDKAGLIMSKDLAAYWAENPDAQLTIVGYTSHNTGSAEYDDIYQMDMRNGIVDGTSDADSMAPGFRDIWNDKVDGADNTGAVSGAPNTDDDVIKGFGGNDTIVAGAGNDSVYGGDGSDSVDGGDGNDRLQGWGDFDNSVDDGAADILDGGAGNDTVLGGGGSDTLLGGLGDDNLYGDDLGGTDTAGGADSISGGAGADSILSGFGNDTVSGGDDNDTVYGGAGDDQIAGDAGDDLLSGELGNDTIAGGLGNDAVAGGEGNDLVQGDDGDDTLSGDAGNDTIDGGVGNDLITGGNGIDSIDGGEGDDTVFGDADDDIVLGNGGLDLLDGGLGNDLLDGGADDDTLSGGDGADTLFGGTGADLISGGEGDDLIADWDSLGGVDDGAADTVLGGGGNDTIHLGEGNDSADGGIGDDSLIAGGGADTLTGGDGFDDFVVSPVDSADDATVITDFNTATGQDIRDGNQANNDFVDLSSFYNADTLATWNQNNPGQTFGNPLEWLRADQADDGILSMAPGLNLEIAGVAPADLTWDNTNVCFAADVLIETDRGLVAAGDLMVGDMVRTRDCGLQPIRWVGRRSYDPEQLAAAPQIRPIRIAAGALGGGLPTADLLVSQQHRVLVRSRIAQRMFGTAEVLVAAKQLKLLGGIDVADDVDSVTYVHFMFDAHQIVFSNGAETESLYTGAEALKSVGPAAREEIFAIFPELRDGQTAPDPVRALVTGRQGRKLAVRHVENRRPLVD